MPEHGARAYLPLVVGPLALGLPVIAVVVGLWAYAPWLMLALVSAVCVGVAAWVIGYLIVLLAEIVFDMSGW